MLTSKELISINKITLRVLLLCLTMLSIAGCFGLYSRDPHVRYEAVRRTTDVETLSKIALDEQELLHIRREAIEGIKDEEIITKLMGELKEESLLRAAAECLERDDILKRAFAMCIDRNGEECVKLAGAFIALKIQDVQYLESKFLSDKQSFCEEWRSVLLERSNNLALMKQLLMEHRNSNELSERDVYNIVKKARKSSQVSTLILMLASEGGNSRCEDLIVKYSKGTELISVIKKNPQCYFHINRTRRLTLDKSWAFKVFECSKNVQMQRQVIEMLDDETCLQLLSKEQPECLKVDLINHMSDEYRLLYSARNGNTEAQLAIVERELLQDEPNVTLINEMILLAGNEPKMMKILARLRLDGDVIGQDIALAAEHVVKSNGEVDYSVAGRIGLELLRGERISRNESLADTCFALAITNALSCAKTNDVQAINFIADCYLNGDGVRCDVAKALAWFEKSERLGDAYAKAHILEERWSESSSEEEKRRIANELVKLSENGELYAIWVRVHILHSIIIKSGAYGVEKQSQNRLTDAEERLLIQRLESEDPLAWRTLGWMRKANFNTEERRSHMLVWEYEDYQERLKWFNNTTSAEAYKKGAALGDRWCVSFLGNCYWDGTGGVKRSYEDGWAWYDKACNLRVRSAMVRKAEAYKEGVFVKKDFKMAMRCYKTAALWGSEDAKTQIRLITNKVKESVIERRRLADYYDRLTDSEREKLVGEVMDIDTYPLGRKDDFLELFMYSSGDPQKGDIYEYYGGSPARSIEIFQVLNGGALAMSKASFSAFKRRIIYIETEDVLSDGDDIPSGVYDYTGTYSYVTTKGSNATVWKFTKRRTQEINWYSSPAPKINSICGIDWEEHEGATNCIERLDKPFRLFDHVCRYYDEYGTLVRITLKSPVLEGYSDVDLNKELRNVKNILQDKYIFKFGFRDMNKYLRYGYGIRSFSSGGDEISNPYEENPAPTTVRLWIDEDNVMNLEVTKRSLEGEIKFFELTPEDLKAEKNDSKDIGFSNDEGMNIL